MLAIITLQGIVMHSFKAVYDDCYTKDTTLIYDRNTNQFTAEFRPTLAEKCFVFSRGLEAQLVLKNQNLTAPLFTTLTNFSYNTTTSVTFFADASVVVDAEDFAEVAIYSTEIAAMLPIFYFEEQKSALDKCFETASFVDIKKNEIQIKVKSTRLCSQEFTNSGGNQLMAVQLKLNGVKFDFPSAAVADMVIKYHELDEIVVELAGVQQDVLQEIRSSILQTAILLFTAEQGTLSVSFEHSISTIRTEGILFTNPILVSSSRAVNIQFFASNCYLGVINEQFVVHAPNDQLFNEYNLLNEVNALVFTAYQIRLTIYRNKDYFTLFENFNSSKYVHRDFLAFKCNYGTKADQKKCRGIMDSIDASAQVLFDVQFFNENALVDIEKANLIFLDNCWLQALVSQQSNGLQLQMIEKPKGRCQFAANQVVVTLILENKNSYTATVPSSTILSGEPIVFECQDCELEDGAFFKVHLASGQQEQLILAEKHINTRYGLVSAITCSVGTALLLGCLVSSIHGMVKMVRQIKEQRKKSRGQ